MVKMAYAPLPNLTPIDTSKICSTNVPKTTLSEVLQSDPVKRLFNQPNIVIKTIPLKKHGTNGSVLTKNNSGDKKNNISADFKKPTPPEVSIVPIKLATLCKEDRDLLPCKIEERSEITIFPVRSEKKQCGHCEPCENIVCDVIVQQFVDHNGITPMLAVNIEEDEINAPVLKHCKNEKCDALSIDHNRCRRALIKLHRCDKSKACDICGITLKTRKARVSHRYCTRKHQYRHNEVDGTQILKERMRERELQMLEDAKTKKNDYLDPITGYSRAIETLRKNEELIIIPKTVPPQPIITITSVPNVQPNQQTNAKNGFGKLLSSVPVFPQQNMVLDKKSPIDENDPSIKHLKLPDILNNTLTTSSTTSPTSSTSQNQYVRFAGTSQPIAINDWLMTQPHIVTTPIQSKPFLTPIRVVPITNLITEPSLLHQTQGVPKFCIMADNMIPSLTVTSSQPSQSVQSTQSTQSTDPATPTTPIVVPNDNNKVESKTIMQKRKKSVMKKSLRRRFKKKDFKCSYCSKHFSTDWYFKMHVAMHKGEKMFSCKICKQFFGNQYDLKKHMTSDHKNEKIPCDFCNHVCNSYYFLEKHMKTHSIERCFKCIDCDIAYATSVNLKYHRRKCHGRVECKYCHKEFAEGELGDHMELEHKKEIKEKEQKRKVISNNNDLRKTRRRCINNAKVESNGTVQNKIKNKAEGKQSLTEEKSSNIKTNGFTFVSVESVSNDAKKNVETNVLTKQDNLKHSNLNTA